MKIEARKGVEEMYDRLLESGTDGLATFAMEDIYIKGAGKI